MSVTGPDPVDQGLCVVGFVYLEVFVPGGFDAPRPGREHFVPDMPVGFGGALNVASVSAALGLPTMLLRPSCGALDPAVRAMAEKLGVEDCSWPSKRPAVSLVYSTPTDRAFLSAADFEALADCPTLPEDGWIHVAGLEEAFLLENPLREARKCGARVCVSGSWAPRALQRLAVPRERRWDLLVLNEAEAAWVDEDSGRVLEILSEVAGDVVITNGPGTVEALMGGERFRVPVPATGPGNYTGVGDAFCAALLSARARGMDAGSSLRRGIAVASRVVTIRGGVVTDRALLSDLVPR